MMGNRAFTSMAAAGLMIPLLAGCLPVDAGGPAGTGAEDVKTSSNQEAAGAPQGAISMSNGVYAVPIAVDAYGCEQFSQWSSYGATQLIILYHDGEGGFTGTKSDRYSCNAEMINVGRDGSGCSTFHAEQPDGKVTDILYYRSGSSFTANPERATCNG